MRRRLVVVVAAVCALAACKKREEPAPAVDAGAPVAVVRDAGVASPATVHLPLTPSTLSVFEPEGERCAWRRVDPVADAGVTLATFEGSCVGARVAWSPDAGEAVVWFDPRHVQVAGFAASFASQPAYPDETPVEGAPHRLFLVSVTGRSAEALPVPEVAGQTLAEVGLDGAGGPLALFEEALPDAVIAKGSVKSNGKVYDLKGFSEGLPELVHARRLEGGQWKLVETKATTTGWDYGPGVRDLDAHGRLGPRSVDLSASHAQGDVAEPKLQTALWPLGPKAAREGDGQWIFLGAGGARVYVWEVSGEFAHTTGALATGSPPKKLPGLGFTDGDLVAVRPSGPFLLVTASGVGTHPRLYELPAARLVFASDTARAVTLWPGAAKPETHE
jgi:hypothetical protein